MQPSVFSRRSLLRGVTAAGAATALSSAPARPLAAGTASHLHLACNQYPWFTFYRRQKRNFNADLDASLAEVAASGVDGFEPLVTSTQQLQTLVPLLNKHRLQMRSLYVNSLLYDPDRADGSIAQVMAIAQAAKAAGTRIVVTNPSPIRWGTEENKSDQQLIFQAKALDRLGARLKSIGLTLAYHNHDVELRNAAREFHHMLLATDPDHVTFCLDAHWIYRGSGDSAVALFDVLKLYGRRVTELHLRQSRDGVWTEALEDGDIDYPAVAQQLLGLGVKPHLVIEQAVEKGTPQTMNAVESHRRSVKYARRVFAAMAG